MNMKYFTALLGLGLMALCILTMKVTAIFLNGGVCSYSSDRVWLTVTESSRQKTYSLAPGHCTNVFKQDAEAIWGRDCSTDTCKYQAWKVGAGRFELEENQHSPLGAVLRIKGWGAGSRWRIAPTWPRPDISTIRYGLIR
ncbi:MAG TPA: hypothetical protein VK249_29325 [Anaerolineales bacterium]|nr:hypothetical protein [Anaerolineales bacterium]